MSLKPIYSQEDPRTGRILWGLAPADFHKVRLGYACPQCLEDFNGVWMATCPVCGHSRDMLGDFQETPEHFIPGREAPAPEARL